MGGFEQKELTLETSRVSLRVSGDATLIASLPSALRTRAGEGLTGIMYGINDERLEILAEGERDMLEPLVAYIQEEAGHSDAADCRESWQLPGGGYDEKFPLVMLSPKMEATITLEGESSTMENYKRHLQVEAVFNRGLKLRWSRLEEGRLEMGCEGDAGRLKSFVRWCYNGPPLARADKVAVTWGSV